MTLTYTGNLGSGVSLWNGLELPLNTPVEVPDGYETDAGNDLVANRPLEFSTL